ncbi:endonuclease Q family protein [Candidatus Micrarchaeota archaeon]|nr:endonuclease Q family protein [Candidatus Micrarchaeota archaeon]
MRIIADLHVHSKYARATSSSCDIPGLAQGAKIKGIGVMATGDFTHPSYFQELTSYLSKNEVADGAGIYKYKDMSFILSTELSVIYELGDKTRKMHHLVLAPSLETAAQINDRMAKYGSLDADGRPMLKISSAGLVEELESISKDIAVIPSHVWTPWFAIFGSKSGVDSVEQAFEDKSDRIFALETGLSSDPQMNWMISVLDKYSLISNSDAHSLGKLGREANVLDIPEISFSAIINAIKTRKGFVKTFEFYPEEGKYHYDGHRKCNILWSPWESERHKNICSVCKRKVTVGVVHRIVDLADRKPGIKPEGAVPFQHIVPLVTIISKTIKKGEATQAVAEEYDRIIRYFGNEFAVFDATEEQLRLATSPEIASSIVKVQKGDVRWVPGYDGVFGELVLDGSKISKNISDGKQKSLGDF